LPGIYIREVSIPAGTFAVGHYQTTEHLNLFLRGKVVMLHEDGSTHELVAPLVYVSPPGRKIGFVTEDMVWQNIYATTETDIDKLEATFLRKSEEWKVAEADRFNIERLKREGDRLDFLEAIAEFGLTPEQVREMSEETSDLIPMPVWVRARIMQSPIEGRGVFVSAPVYVGDVIGPARIRGKRTPLGRFTNHAKNPNAVMVQHPNGDIDLVALNRIEGCQGGDQGEEVTIDYRQSAALSAVRRRDSLGESL
jgi:hypothetical protein